MASASTPTTQIGSQLGSNKAVRSTFVLPDFLRCLVVSWSDQRSQLLQSAAEDESWHAKVCSDVQEFLQSVFLLDVPLTIVDLPPRGTASYAELREMATQTCGVNRALLVVCGAANDSDEELWARQLGAWAYLPGATDLGGLRLVFAEARKALANQSASYQPAGCPSAGGQPANDRSAGDRSAGDRSADRVEVNRNR